jgi:hypothetical protein
MAEIVAIVGAAGLFIAGFVASYTMWHRRMAASFERVRVGDDRSARVARRGADLPGRRH